MPYTYTVSIGGRDFDIDSDQRLSDVQAYEAAKSKYDEVEARDVAERRKTAFTPGAEGFRQSAKEEASTRSGTARFLQGAGETFDRYALGLKGLFTDLSPEDRARLQHNKIMAQEGGWAAMGGQIAGDAAITAPLTVAGGYAAPLLARGTQQVANQTVGRMLPQSLMQLGGRLATSTPARIAGAGITGGAIGAVGDPEERASGALWGAGGNMVGALPRALRVARARSGEADVAGRAAQDVGRTAAELADDIEAGMAEAARFRIPVTAAQASRSPELAAKELGVRGTLPNEFAHFQRTQNEAVYDAAQRATRSAPDVAQNAAARDTITAPLRDAALEAADRNAGANIAVPIMQHLEQLRAGRTGANPNVERLAQIVERELTRPGGTNAGRLYELEKYLRDRLTGPHHIGDDVSAQLRGVEREVNRIREAINSAIDEASGGQWRNYLEGYAWLSRHVDDAAASQGVREAMTAPGRALVGDAPHVTARTLALDVERAGAGGFVDATRFGPVTNRELNELVQFARRIEEPMRTLKLAGTGGGGSQTVTQAAQVIANFLDFFGGDVVSAPLRAAIKAMNGVDQQHLARLMLNPEQAVEALRRAAMENAPLTPAEQMFRQLAQTGGRSEAGTAAGGQVLRQTLGGN